MSALCSYTLFPFCLSSKTVSSGSYNLFTSFSNPVAFVPNIINEIYSLSIIFESGSVWVCSALVVFHIFINLISHLFILLLLLSLQFCSTHRIFSHHACASVDFEIFLRSTLSLRPLFTFLSSSATQEKRVQRIYFSAYSTKLKYFETINIVCVYALQGFNN